MIATVGPASSTNSSSSAATTMLISDSTFTPPSSPRSTEISATAVMPAISRTWTPAPIGAPKT